MQSLTRSVKIKRQCGTIACHTECSYFTQCSTKSDNESSPSFLQYISKNLDLFEKFITDRNYMLLFLGLLLIFDIKVKEYLQDLTLEEGIRILIGDQDEPLYPVEKGISIEPGVSASISIKKVKNVQKVIHYMQNKQAS